MKFYKIAVVFACCQFVTQTIIAQENEVTFNYDAGGNMTQRSVQVMPGGRIGNFNAPRDSAQREFKVFPNPTNQFLTIEGALPENTSSGDLSLINMNGQVLKKDSYTGQPKTLPMSDLKPGMYLLEIRYSKKDKSTYKIIVNN
jgi:hypothetical protein